MCQRLCVVVCICVCTPLFSVLPIILQIIYISIYNGNYTLYYSFPSLSIVKKSHSFTSTRTPTRKEFPLTPFAQRHAISKSVTSTPLTAKLTGRSAFPAQPLHATATTTIINQQRALPTTAKRFFARQTLANLLAPFHANNTH